VSPRVCWAMPDNVSPGATVYAATQVEVETAWMERLTGEELRAHAADLCEHQSVRRDPARHDQAGADRGRGSGVGPVVPLVSRTFVRGLDTRGAGRCIT